MLTNITIRTLRSFVLFAGQYVTNALDEILVGQGLVEESVNSDRDQQVRHHPSFCIKEVGVLGVQ